MLNSSVMQAQQPIGFLLKIDGRIASFHKTLAEAQEAAKGAPERAMLGIQTTYGAVRSWSYDRARKIWVDQP